MRCTADRPDTATTPHASAQTRQDLPRHARHPARPAPLAAHAARLGHAAATGRAGGRAHPARPLAPGARLPSVREGARLHGVSPSTVVPAYDQLQAQGLVEARRQRGFFVREPRPRPAARAAARRPAAARTLAPPVDATALIRGMFQQGSAPSGPGMGTLPEAWLDAGPARPRAAPQPGPRARRRAALRQPGRRRIPAPGDGAPAGRRAGHRRRGRARSSPPWAPPMRWTWWRARLLQPGDAVLVDEPGWAVEFARLTRMGMRLLPVPRGADGPDLAVMARLLAAAPAAAVRHRLGAAQPHRPDPDAGRGAPDPEAGRGRMT